MHRNLLPFILASLGYVIFLLATSVPLFEWQISEIVTDFPPTYKVNISPYPLTTRLGTSLDNGLYVGRVYVSKDGRICRYKDLSFVATRSQNDEALEQVSLNINEKYIPWLEGWVVMGIYLSGIYLWWFTIWYKRPIWEAIGLTALAIFIFILLTQIVRPFLWRVGPSPEYFGILDCYHGTVGFNVGLLKVHYETLIIFIAGLLLELAAIVMMLQQIIRAVMKKSGPFPIDRSNI
jgi:hypothetical protein